MEAFDIYIITVLFFFAAVIYVVLHSGPKLPGMPGYDDDVEYRPESMHQDSDNEEH